MGFRHRPVMVRGPFAPLRAWGALVGRPARTFGRERTKSNLGSGPQDGSSRAGRPGARIPR